MIKIYKNYKTITFEKPRVITIGRFDGIHLGHKKIFNITIREARKHNCKAAAVTFNFRGRKKLTLDEEKNNIMDTFGIDEVIQLESGKGWMDWPPRKFIEDFLIGRLKCRAAVVGTDFKFGKDRLGSVETLQEYNFNLLPVELMQDNKRKVSSFYIKQLISEGRVAQASKTLGRPYSFQGKVIKGRGVGKKIGFSTINFKVPEKKLLPEGVFEVAITLAADKREEIKQAVCFIGPVRVKGIKKSSRTVEVHIPEYTVPSGSMARKTEFIRFIRRPVKFKSRQELIAQIKKDIETL